MVESDANPTAAKSFSWLNRTVLGLALATFFSDFGHELCTAVLPLYLASGVVASVGTGALALGLIEGIANFLVSISKLGGGVLGHYVERKRPWVAAGYAITALATGSLALVRSLPSLIALRSVAWIARGYRGPLRDDLMASAVEKTHYGRAYGLERAGDMLGAVSGPLVALVLVGLGLPLGSVILFSVFPGLASAAAILFLVREPKASDHKAGETKSESPSRHALLLLPGRFWMFLVGVGIFGLGDFSRAFVVYLAAKALEKYHMGPVYGASLAVLVYVLHNFVSAVAAFPVGWLGDHFSKGRLLALGYALGAATNLLLAWQSSSLVWLVLAVIGSGIYIAVEETLEKATAATLLPRAQRSLGFGVLASANAVGDMASSIYVGWLLEHNAALAAFGIAAIFGLLGALWIGWIMRRGDSPAG